MRVINIFFVFLALACGSSLAQTIQVTGSNWNPVISSASVTEAGLDYTSDASVQSSSSQSTISLAPGGGFLGYYFGAWRVDVRKVNTNWDNRLKIYARRTSNGSGFFGGIQNGTSYQEIQNVDQSFFDGSGYRNNITIQYSISGFSVLIPVDTYSTTVMYTLIDL